MFMFKSVPSDPYLKRLNEKAIIMRAENQYEEAFNYQASIEHLFGESFPLQFRRFHNGFGITCFNLGLYERAIKEYETAFNTEAGDEDEPVERAAHMGNKANALVELDRIREAHECLDYAERILRERQIDDWLGDRLETRARAYLKEGKLKEAHRAAEEAYRLHCVSFSEASIRVSKKTLDLCAKALEDFAHRGKPRGVHAK
jgi:tetratricopeptide (TPR) repeat protein